MRDGALPSGLPSPPPDWLSACRAGSADAAAAIGPPGLVPQPSERTRLYPEDEPGEVLLADLPDIVLAKADGGKWNLTAHADLSVRRTHLPTWVIEELIGEVLTGRVGRTPAPDAGGPRVTRIRLRDDHVRVELNQNVVEGTVPQALELRSFNRAAGAQGWSDPLPVQPVVTPAQPGTPPALATVAFDLPVAPTADLGYRLVL